MFRQQQYQYEADGQLAEIRGNQPRRYRYDKAGQLQTVSYPDSQREQHHAEKTELFNYDPTGNKINEKQPLSAQAFAANSAKGNRLIFFSDKHFAYDRFGNLITEKRGKNQSIVTHYEYDCRHRLIKVIKPTGMIITYTYDPFNRRTSKTVNGKTTKFIWQGNKLIAETDNDRHWQSYIYEPDSFRPLALIKGNAQQDKIQRYWYQNDQLGTPIRLTDSIGETLYQCEYNAYGQVIDENYYSDHIDTLPDNPLRFQGQYYDEETGLHYNLNRYYDPFVGRYITQDPLGILGGLNAYQYCQNPVNWIDPLGLFDVSRNGFEGIVDKGSRVSSAQDAFSELPLVRPRSVDKIDPVQGQFVLDKTSLTKLSKDEVYIYVIDSKNNIKLALRGDAKKGAKHTQLSGGEAVKGAGELKMNSDDTLSINNSSGRYRAQSKEAIYKLQSYLSSNMNVQTNIIEDAFK